MLLTFTSSPLALGNHLTWRKLLKSSWRILIYANNNNKKVIDGNTQILLNVESFISWKCITSLWFYRLKNSSSEKIFSCQSLMKFEVLQILHAYIHHLRLEYTKIMSEFTFNITELQRQTGRVLLVLIYSVKSQSYLWGQNLSHSLCTHRLHF